MNKQAKSILSVSLILVVISLILLMSYSFFMSAAFTFGSDTGRILNSDILFSPVENNVSVSVLNASNATLMGAPGSEYITNVYANFTGINATACNGRGILPLRNNGSGWFGNCTVASFFTTTSRTVPFTGNISFIIESNTSGNVSSLAPLVIAMHNLDAPNMSMQGPSCQMGRLGSSTTNFSTITNFNAVNFIFDMEMNMSCNSGGYMNGTAPGLFTDALTINFTSLNLSDPTQAALLMRIGEAIQVNITSPRSFGNSRIYLNSTFFSALSSNASLTFYHLPFASIPTVVGDNNDNLNSTSITWVSNGYVSTYGMITGNLTFRVFGFSGYNATDNTVPVVTIVKPTASQVFNVANVTINVTVNGTGTAPSYVTLELNSSLTLTYNGSAVPSSFGTANCTNNTAGGDMYTCFLNQTLAEGAYTMTATAWDYGGVSGNVNSATRTFYVNLTRFSLDNTSISISSTSATISYGTNKSANISVAYGTTAGLGLNASSTSFSSSGSLSLSGLSASTVYYYNITVCDSVTNCIVNGTNNFTTLAATTNATTTTSSSSGGGSAATISTNVNLAEGVQKIMIVGDSVKFSVNSEAHSISVQTIKGGKVTLKIASEPQYVTLEPGQETKVNLNNDTTFDLYVKLNAIKSGAADLTIRTISEVMPAGTSGALVQNATDVATTTETSSEKKSKTWIWITLAICLVLIGLGVWYYFFKKKEY